MITDPLRYPIGPFGAPSNYSSEYIQQRIADIDAFPTLLHDEIQGLTDADFDKKYRPGGWNIRQVVHHCADSHMNAYIRFKLAITEDKPTIKPYREDLWAELPDTLELSVMASMKILEGVHLRWVTLLRTLGDNEWAKSYFHPEHKQFVTLREALANYSWHCRHHLEHTRIAKRKGSLS